VGGLAGVLDRRTVGTVWVSPLSTPAGEAAVVRREADGRGVVARTPPVGATGTVGRVSWQVLGPLAGDAAAVAAEGESGQQNDASLVLLLTVAGVRLLLTGDVEPPGQRAILAAGTDLHADVLKVPHHGSARQEEAFLAATHARIAVASAGVDNDYGHPAPSTVARLQGLGMSVLATNQHGAIAVGLRRGRLVAVTER
jgi:competence protein ComEC